MQECFSLGDWGWNAGIRCSFAWKMVGNEAFAVSLCGFSLKKFPSGNAEISSSLVGGKELIGFVLEAWVVLEAGEIPEGLEVTPLVPSVILGWYFPFCGALAGQGQGKAWRSLRDGKQSLKSQELIWLAAAQPDLGWKFSYFLSWRWQHFRAVLSMMEFNRDLGI